MIKRLLIVILVFTATIISAQRNNSSPYSNFGIGEKFSTTTVEQSSMGGIGVAMKSLNHLNFTNPASNADLRYATYALGGQTTFLKIKETNTTQSGNSTSLSYVSLGFPIGKKAGFSTGLQPLSSVGYSISNNNTALDQITKISGKGGTNRIYGSFGMYVFEGLSLGVEGSFIFGTVDNSILSVKSGDSRATKYHQDSNIRGGEFKIGAQYKTQLKSGLELNSGIAMKLKSNLTQTGNERLYSLNFGNSGTEIIKETSYDRAFNKTIERPLSTILGFGVGKTNKWYAGINSEFQAAITNYDFTNQNLYRYEDAMRTSIGGYYIPKINSISSYWDRVTYRAGFRYEKTGLLVNGNPNTGNNFTRVNDFGINIGLGLPLPKSLSNLNFGFEYGQKGTITNNLIKEDYFNVRLSLSLNDLFWFKKRQID